MSITLSTRAAVARELARAGGEWVSGETIAQRLGISRAAVGKHIASLRELGYDIASGPHVGYRLSSAPDACIPEEVAGRLQNPVWVACEGAKTITSTNDEAKRLAARGAPEGTAVVASCQTAGRGRFGRAWDSPEGGAYVSFVVRPDRAPSEVQALPLLAGLGVARALRSLGVAAGLKWPNDVVVGKRKIAGVLVEMAAEADEVSWAVIGCGVNVGRATQPQAAFVREAVPQAGVAEVAAAVLDGMADTYREFLAGGFAGLQDEYASLLVLSGEAVRVKDAGGRVIAEGVVAGVDHTGALVIDTGRGRRRLVSGEVTLRD